MRRLWFLPVIGFLVYGVLVIGVVFLLPTLPARAQVRPGVGFNVAQSTYAISSGDGGACSAWGSGASLAFDANSASCWGSLQTGTTVENYSWLGQDFGVGNAHSIGRILVNQSPTAGNDAGSVYLEYSDDCSNFSAAGTYSLLRDGTTQIIDVPDQGAHRCWRIRQAGTWQSSTARWFVLEVQMLPYEATSVPSATPTMSDTATPTPDYFIEVTSTLGSPMRLERSATIGDALIFGAMGCVAVLLVLGGLIFVIVGRRR